MSDAPTCPRCGSDDTVCNPDTDVPGANPDFGCDECLYLWNGEAAETGQDDVFEDFAEAEAVRWLDRVHPVVDAGDHISDVEGRHLELEADDRDENIVLHERLVTRWATEESRHFEPIATANPA
ncbi:hypothetical protein [Halorhabdus rudnickae]|uniref:hypothetical protein n=1 Tax=Halorhabdus rudnickae TaxID=1775544 RepID=UPI00108278D0|nr:hypothetical protein [Halorhabdus rudnickae]